MDKAVQYCHVQPFHQTVLFHQNLTVQYRKCYDSDLYGGKLSGQIGTDCKRNNSEERSCIKWGKYVVPNHLC